MVILFDEIYHQISSPLILILSYLFVKIICVLLVPVPDICIYQIYVLHIPDIFAYTRYMYCKYLLSLSGLIFHSLKGVFDDQMFWILTQISAANLQTICNWLRRIVWQVLILFSHMDIQCIKNDFLKDYPYPPNLNGTFIINQMTTNM